MEKRVYETELFLCEIIDGIAEVTLKLHDVITLELAKKMVKERLIFFDGKKYPLVIDLRTVKYSDKATRNYLNTDGLEGIKAGALVTNSTSAKVFFNLYLNFTSLPFPSRVFTNKNEALEWLRKYV